MTILRGRLALLLALLSAPGCAGGQGARTGAPSTSFQRADTAALHRTLDSLAGAHHGVVDAQHVSHGPRTSAGARVAQRPLSHSKRTGGHVQADVGNG